jgi:hypothetical protein
MSRFSSTQNCKRFSLRERRGCMKPGRLVRSGLRTSPESSNGLRAHPGCLAPSFADTFYAGKTITCCASQPRHRHAYSPQKDSSATLRWAEGLRSPVRDPELLRSQHVAFGTSESRRFARPLPPPKRKKKKRSVNVVHHHHHYKPGEVVVEEAVPVEEYSLRRLREAPNLNHMPPPPVANHQIQTHDHDGERHCEPSQHQKH